MRLPFSRAKIEDLDKYIAAKDYDRALEAVAAELEKNPEKFNMLMRQAEVLGRAGDPKKAVKIYRRLGERYARDGFYAKAIAFYKKVLSFDPSLEEVNQELAKLIEEDRAVRKLSDTGPAIVGPAIARPVKKEQPEPAPAVVPDTPMAPEPTPLPGVGGEAVAEPAPVPSPEPQTTRPESAPEPRQEPDLRQEEQEPRQEPEPGQEPEPASMSTPEPAPDQDPESEWGPEPVIGPGIDWSKVPDAGDDTASESDPETEWGPEPKIEPGIDWSKVPDADSGGEDTEFGSGIDWPDEPEAETDAKAETAPGFGSDIDWPEDPEPEDEAKPEPKPEEELKWWPRSEAETEAEAEPEYVEWPAEEDPEGKPPAELQEVPPEESPPQAEAESGPPLELQEVPEELPPEAEAVPGPPPDLQEVPPEELPAEAEADEVPLELEVSVDPELQQQEMKELQASRLFASFGNEALEEIIYSTSVHSYSEGDIIVTEGELGQSLFLIVAGKVKVFTIGERGEHLPLAELGPGDFFGEVSLLTGRPRTATITAKEPVAVIELTAADINRIAEKHPEVWPVLTEFYEQRAKDTVEAVIRRMRTES